MYLGPIGCILEGMHSGERWRLGHRPGLTGLRAVAVGLVLLTHAHALGAKWLGDMGVAMFFTLSGFLITTLLLEERQSRGRFSLRAFYLRRARRLGPALLVCVGVAVIVELATTGRVANWSLVAGALTWSSNLVMIHLGHSATPLTHTWSLSVEEQFYLLWPLLLTALARIRRKYALLVLTYLAAASVIYRVFIVNGSGPLDHAYFGLDVRADELLIGAMLAFALVGSRATRHVDPHWAGVLIAAIVVPGVLGAFVPMGGHVFTTTVVAVLTAGLLYVVTHSRVGWLEGTAMVWVGERAYGVYLYHLPGKFLVDAVLPTGVPWFVSGILMVAVTLVAAWASYRWVETPFRSPARSRERLDRGAIPVARGAEVEAA